MPLPSMQNPPSEKEIFFPVNMISLCLTQMWGHGLVQESERLLFTVMDVIQKQCLVIYDHSTLLPCTHIEILELYW